MLRAPVCVDDDLTISIKRGTTRLSPSEALSVAETLNPHLHATDDPRRAGGDRTARDSEPMRNTIDTRLSRLKNVSRERTGNTSCLCQRASMTPTRNCGGAASCWGRMMM